MVAGRRGQSGSTGGRPLAVVAGATGDLQLTFYSPFGVLLQGKATYGSALSVDGRLSAIWAFRGLTLGGGVGSASVSR